MVAPANKNNTTIAVIGAGPAGMISALAAAQKGYSSYLIGPKTNNNDLRTTALMMPAIKILDSLGIWKNLQDKAAALSTMRIVDGTKRLIRSPVVSFHSSEIGEIAFGYNMPNVALNNAINEAVTGCKLIKRLDVPAKSIVHSDDHVTITLEDNSHVDAQLLIAADGRNSKARIAAGIDCRQWNYPQTAVILSFSHEFPHNNISTEFHTEDGPFTQVPLPGKKSSLVWVLNPERANRILGLGPEGLASAIEERMQAMLGKVTVITPAQAWPLSGIVPKSFADKRTILVGEAAHVFPPIGAQGLNLGIRDAINMVKAIESDSKDPGSEQVMENYNKYRKADIWVRTGSVHALNKALLSDMLPVQFVRSAGLEVLRNFAPLRNIFMREGMYPGNGLRALAKVLCPTSKSRLTN
ncbi:UbiH/UbiF family hydroxylase [uncultured Bartonella sp.]|uniref:UbiH/UbiF family hydroxylase n=1 Tax=uncultured Bartonella sp. TaxID=104108 RepID=UPI0026015AC5|nr:UbiH/UbiF family hydroxylase [uncultured Bartonella sp.]